MEHNLVGWFEIYVDDMDRAKTFYQTVFQTGDFIDLSNDDTQMFAFHWIESAPGSSGSLVKSQFNKPSANGTIVYFVCDDCAVEEKRAAENGGKIMTPKMDIGETGFISVLTDTEGNTIGLYSKK